MANKKTVVVESNRLNRVLSDRHAFFDNFLKMPQALQTPDRNRPAQTVDTNVYTIKKSLMTLLCLLIIIMVNSIHLKFVIRNGRSLFSQFYTFQVTLCITSILFSIIIGIVLMYSARLNYNDAYKQRKLDFINNIIMVLLFLLCIINIFLVSMN